MVLSELGIFDAQRCVVLCCIVLCCAVLCYIMLSYVMSYHVMSCHILHIMSCYVMLCYVVQCAVSLIASRSVFCIVLYGVGEGGGGRSRNHVLSTLH